MNNDIDRRSYPREAKRAALIGTPLFLVGALTLAYTVTH